MSSTKKKRTSITSRRIMRVSRDIVDACRLGGGDGQRSRVVWGTPASPVSAQVKDLLPSVDHVRPIVSFKASIFSRGLDYLIRLDRATPCHLPPISLCCPSNRYPCDALDLCLCALWCHLRALGMHQRSPSSAFVLPSCSFVRPDHRLVGFGGRKVQSLSLDTSSDKHWR